MSSKPPIDLYEALASLQTREQIERFMLDLATPGERTAFEERWDIAWLLEAGELSYRDIAAQTGASTTTVSRVNRFLKQEKNGGYRLIFDRFLKK
ncbi:MAG: TrpR like protein, YerC/YecD [Alphaproteobacteria bacterium]|nr:TrpR like protein, YerC/YecD [Alphaproteobacteria bacterium]